MKNRPADAFLWFMAEIWKFWHAWNCWTSNLLHGKDAISCNMSFIFSYIYLFIPCSCVVVLFPLTIYWNLALNSVEWNANLAQVFDCWCPCVPNLCTVPLEGTESKAAEGAKFALCLKHVMKTNKYSCLEKIVFNCEKLRYCRHSVKTDWLVFLPGLTGHATHRNQF